MTISEILSGAVVPGIGIGVGYLSTFRVTNLVKSGYEPGMGIALMALMWQFIILPANVIAAFLDLPWFWALLVFPSILVPGTILAGFLAEKIGDKSAACIGPPIGLAIAGWKLCAHFGIGLL